MATASGFTKDDLRALAGERSFERGVGYLGAVTGLEVTAGGVTATVYGGDVYGVALTFDAGEGLSGECGCPYGRDGNFCKHCVAVGLTVLNRGLDLAEARAAARDRGERLDAWLEALPREELLALLREQLTGDNALRHRLEIRAATDAGADITVLRPQIMTLLDPAPFSRYGHIEYADAFAYAEQVAGAVDALRSLPSADHRVSLAREAIERLRQVYDQIDDSSGAVGEVAAELEEVHREACATSDVDPAKTAEWLAAHLLDDGSYPEVYLGDYWGLLGDAGRSRLAELVAEASRHGGSGWAVAQVTKDIARLGGDVDTLVATLAADLAPYGQTHLTIAQELDRAGRGAEALEWAVRGLRETARHPFGADPLGDYVTERYDRDGRLADVVAVRRERFHASPSLAGYRDLRDAARKAGSWDGERTAALDVLGDGPLLVDALIDDGDTDAAWRAAEEGAGDRQWLALADLTRDDRPADALTVYRRAIESRSRLTGDGNYREIARLLRSARDCHERLGTESEFASYVTGLRTAQRRKRNLLRILDQQGL
ncbi:SWIM zinc finger family protein [Actinoallomurus sp. CA-142502]|uniref:SWIM zinc finger family protein n=1 Tax=Actinoallomurus sp. CA-142502 TaxID=3239885 RepID=UPI003D929BE1